MSSILEALERAEEERGNGAKRAMGIAPPVEAGSRFNISLILLLVALFVALALGVWFYTGRATPMAGSEPPPQALPIEPKVSVQEQVIPTTPAKASPSVAEQLRRNALPSAKPLMDEVLVAKPSPPKSKIAPSVVRTAAPPPPMEGRVTTARPSQQDSTEQQIESAVKLESRAVEVVSQPVIEPVANSPEERPAESEAPAVQADIPLVWELPQIEREKVLQLKSSVHVYNKDPSQRFVIINMHRYIEGDTLPPDGFRLERIDQDGVVIDYGGGLVRLLRR